MGGAKTGLIYWGVFFFGFYIKIEKGKKNEMKSAFLFLVVHSYILNKVCSPQELTLQGS